jgi:hypothetical protein
MVTITNTLFMQQDKIQIKITQIIRDIESGLTRYEKDSIGFGSVQRKFGMTDLEVELIFRHPLLRNVNVPSIRFVLVDDTQTNVPEASSIKGPQALMFSEEPALADEPSFVTAAKTDFNITPVLETREEETPQEPTPVQSVVAEEFEEAKSFQSAPASDFLNLL